MYTERDGRNVFHRSPVDSPDITSSPMPTVPCNVVGARIPMDPIRIFRPPTQTFFHDHLGDGKGVMADHTNRDCNHLVTHPFNGHPAPDLSYNGCVAQSGSGPQRLAQFDGEKAQHGPDLGQSSGLSLAVGGSNPPAPTTFSYNGGVR